MASVLFYPCDLKITWGRPSGTTNIVEPAPRKIKNYRAASLESPFREWTTRKIDAMARAAVNVRLRRIEETGNYGDCEPVGDGVFELRIDKGPGYRVYFGVDGDSVILLGGGDKRTQVSDIRKAKERWSDYNA
jgi:putative addiction module killer protein